MIRDNKGNGKMPMFALIIFFMALKLSVQILSFQRLQHLLKPNGPGLCGVSFMTSKMGLHHVEM